MNNNLINPNSSVEQNHDLVQFLFHEFKTPLHIFKSIIQLLQNDQTPNSEQLDKLESVCSSYSSLIDSITNSPRRNWTPQALEDLKRQILDKE